MTIQATAANQPGRSKISAKAARFTESVIREMSRLAVQHKAINLAQGFPDFSAPQELKDAAAKAIQDDVNQYAITWGDKQFRDALAEKTKRTLGLTIDPETQITVTCGATEAMVAAMLATVDPGDEVIVFEPYYENYGPDAILAGAIPKYVTLKPPHWTFDPDELKKAFTNKTKAIIINTPNNPTGKVFSREELQLIADLCQKWDVLAFTDEIYEHILYDGADHIAIATLPGMEDRTVTINGLSKTYSVTGWRIGTMIASKELTGAIRKVHDFLTVGAAAPLQRAGATALRFPDSYYQQLGALYNERRTMLMDILKAADIPFHVPKGAYYILANIKKFGFESDVAFTRFLIETVGVADVPGSSFFSRPELGHDYVRFCFCKKPETLKAAGDRLADLHKHLKNRK
jgi:aspartate/methionine/tyrosine aminotransferase